MRLKLLLCSADMPMSITNRLFDVCVSNFMAIEFAKSNGIFL
jgi:hypothetical protein